MSGSSKNPLPHVLRILVAFTPWVVSMYALYWLEYGEIWTTETPHRGKTSVAILVVGMILSFLTWSRLSKRNDK